MLPRLVGYSALEAGIAGLALYLRSRVGPINAATLIVATLAFLFWEGVVQAIMTAMISVYVLTPAPLVTAWAPAPREPLAAASAPSASGSSASSRCASSRRPGR